MPRVSRTGLAAGVVVATLITLTACVGAGATGTHPATRGHAAAGITDTAEVVMGTLRAPPSRSFLARVRHGRMGGVLLLGNGWLSHGTAVAVTSELQQAACTRGEPLLTALDQEGGAVKRLTWAPPTRAPASMRSPTDAHAQAMATAASLRSVGIDVDFAPVADTPDSPWSFLGSRAFSRSRFWNAEMVRAFAGGLQQSGIAATAKHFPGLGLSTGNTDKGRIVIDSAAWKLREGLTPFRSAVRAGVQLVMVSSAIYPALDPRGKPAVFSRPIVQGLLRKELGFRGVAVTDSLTAPAAARVPHAATRAMSAGDDLLIFGAERSSEQAYSTLAADAVKRPHLRARLAQAAERVRALKAWLAARGGTTCSTS
jgi:beta-N-acetylhexosaminidase